MLVSLKTFPEAKVVRSLASMVYGFAWVFQARSSSLSGLAFRVRARPSGGRSSSVGSCH